MSESSGTPGCLASFVMMLATIFGSFMAAFHTVSSMFDAPPQIITHVTLAPIGTFTTDELNLAAAVITKRLSGLELSTSTVEISGNTSIRVGLPQVDNLDDVLKTLIARGLLEFVDFSDIPKTDIPKWLGQTIVTTGQGAHSISETALKNPGTNEPFETILTGTGIKAATAEESARTGNRWGLSIDFTDEAAKVMQEYTRTHIGTALAIVLDGQVVSAPTIQAELSTHATITGSFTEPLAKRLALQLAGGALPFEMQMKSIQSDDGISVGTATPTTSP